MERYRAMISSDWNECLAPCGPFDAMAYAYPDLAEGLESVFRRYTGNEIPLGRAAGQIRALLPAPLTERQMDAYLDAEFRTYTGVPRLIRWCGDHGVLFMINTTGMIGYFQRIFARGLLPRVPVLSAHPLVRFLAGDTDPEVVMPLFETADKAGNTSAALTQYAVSPENSFVIGDSGGDGPHFEWAAASGVTRIGSMTKPSLSQYCAERQIDIDIRFGISYAPGQPRAAAREMEIDFMDLAPVIQDRAGL